MNKGSGGVLHDLSGNGRDISLNSSYSNGSWVAGRYSVESGNSYRYGFNGQEHSNEIRDDDYTAQFWEYDSRIGRRWNVDPRPTVGVSSYAALDNNPICRYDILGDSGFVFIETKSHYQRVYEVDKEYANDPLNALHVLRIPNPIPKGKDIIFLVFNRETNGVIRDEQREQTRKRNGGLRGSKINGTDAHECAYASTKQGGDNSATTMRLVPATKNQEHGRAIGDAYRTNNTKDGERFFVALIDDEDDQGNKSPLPVLPPLPVLEKMYQNQQNQRQKQPQNKNAPVLSPGRIAQPEYPKPSINLPSPTTVVVGVAVGYGLYQFGKWALAVALAPETGGASLVVAASTP